MDKSLLIKGFGFPAALVHGDPMVLDRWLWLRRRLPRTRNGERLLELGCGTGAFSIGAALRGYRTLGLSWDARNQRVAAERAALCGAPEAAFEVQDLRTLNAREDLTGAFDVVIACEVIEHILDDRRFLRDAAAALKPGGRLLLTAPYHNYVAIEPSHEGPFSVTEDGGHVRRGYSAPMLLELCTEVGLVPEAISHCSGIVSQQLTSVHCKVARRAPLLAWMSTLVLRPIPPVVDPLLSGLSWPNYSICLEAYKPRFASAGSGTTEGACAG